MTNILTKIIKANQEYEILGGGSSSTGEEHEVITQAAYDQLTPAQKAEKVYMITENGVPGSGLTAGAGIDITNNIISADMTTAVYDNTTSGMTATNVQGAIDEVFQSVSNGKTIIAAAITDKGVQTAATDSFQTMATNIESLMVGGKYYDNSIGDLVYETSMGRDSTAAYIWGTSTKQEEDGHDIYYFFFIGCGQSSYYIPMVFRVDTTTNRIKTYARGSMYINGLFRMTIEKKDNVIYFGHYNGSQETPIIEYNTATGEFSNSTTYLNGTDIKDTQGKGVAISGYGSTGFSTPVGGRTFVINIIGDSYYGTYNTYVIVK